MIQNPQTIIDDFRNALEPIGLRCGHIHHEAQPCPHKPHGLPGGRCAVYVFSLSESSGRHCAAGSGRVLKIGRAGPNSNPRFQSHHYNAGRAPSTLAATLVKSIILWPYLGIAELSDTEAGDWIRTNTDRDNFYLEAEDHGVLDDLERYLKGRLSPVFEGG